MSTPRIAVAVASHARPLRLRWLLNALAEQTLARESWELVVAHDSGADSETERLLREHPAVDRHVTFSGTRGPAELRNAAWRATSAPLVAFTDDDCRPPADWLERAARAGREDAIVQGATRPDPDEAALLRAPHPRTVRIDPPTWSAQTCNIVYPRTVLERLDGFDAQGLPLCAGEDTDLAWRARALGVAVVGAPEVVTYHCVEAMGLWPRARFTWRWRQLPALVRRHPELRRELPLGVFWKPRHAAFVLALAGLAAARRSPLAAAVLAAPWARAALPSYGAGPRGRLRAAAELPGQAVIDGVEIAALAVGSARYRTLFL
jgi:GT2 family glycosyltransferase